MVIPLRTGFAAGLAATLALAIFQTYSTPAPSTGTSSFLDAEPAREAPSPGYGGCAALAVGGLGLFARMRRP